MKTENPLTVYADKAREMYVDGETVQIDDEPQFSETDDGCWVAAWVFVSNEDILGEDAGE